MYRMGEKAPHTPTAIQWSNCLHWPRSQLIHLNSLQHTRSIWTVKTRTSKRFVFIWIRVWQLLGHPQILSAFNCLMNAVLILWCFSQFFFFNFAIFAIMYCLHLVSIIYFLPHILMTGMEHICLGCSVFNSISVSLLVTNRTFMFLIWWLSSHCVFNINK